jgi:hypothetical protein
MDVLLGFMLFAAPGWFFILKPAIFGLKQMLGMVDPTAEAVESMGVALQGLFADIRALAQASNPDKLATVFSHVLKDLFSGKKSLVVKDAAILIGGAEATYQHYTRQWAPHLTALKSYPAPKMITVVHGFWSWLRSAPVAPVIQAAGRRCGLGEDVVSERQRQIRTIVAEHAPNLAHGFWYGLYAILICQFLLLELVFVWGRPAPLLWMAVCLIAFNVIKVLSLLRDGLRIWPVRHELLAIAETAGIPSLPKYALRLLVGQALGVVTMLLLVIRFLALGEALKQPGNILSGLHQVILWIVHFYLTLVGDVMRGLAGFS